MSDYLDRPVYDDVLDDARRDFACNRDAFPADDDQPTIAELPDSGWDDQPGMGWPR